MVILMAQSLLLRFDQSALLVYFVILTTEKEVHLVQALRNKDRPP